MPNHKTKTLEVENARLTVGRIAALEQANTLNAKNRRLQATVATLLLENACALDRADIVQRENTLLAALVVSLIDENDGLRVVVRQADAFMSLDSE